MRKKVYICAPIHNGSDNKKNIKDAKIYTKYVIKSGGSPIVPQLYASIDIESEERDTILKSVRLSLLWFCDEMWIFGDKITETMSEEIRFCNSFNIKIKKIQKDEPRRYYNEKKV